MKKLLYVFLVVCLTFLTGCGSNPEMQMTMTSSTISVPEVTEPTEAEPEAPIPSTYQPDTDPVEPEPEVIQITMTFVGDCTFGRNHKASYYNSFDAYYDQFGSTYFLENVCNIFENDDITVINLEGPLTTSDDIQKKTWNHRGDPAYVEIMTGSSVEVAAMANNHRLDYGQSGSDETEQVLRDAGVTYCFNDKYAIYEVKGVKVGIVSVNALEGYRVEKWLKEGHEVLRDEGCVVVAAMVHWGDDKATETNSYQRSLGPRIIEMGYDVVVGHHSHVLQAMQEHKGKLICYSLGNFCYGGSKNPADKDSGIFQQTFTIIDGELQKDVDAKLIPCYLSSIKDRNDYRPTLAVGEEFQRIIQKINRYSERFGFMLDEEGRPLLEEE